MELIALKQRLRWDVAQCQLFYTIVVSIKTCDLVLNPYSDEGRETGSICTKTLPNTHRKSVGDSLDQQHAIQLLIFTLQPHPSSEAICFLPNAADLQIPQHYCDP